jgi:hypothetical protein
MWPVRTLSVGVVVELELLPSEDVGLFPRDLF